MTSQNYFEKGLKTNFFGNKNIKEKRYWSCRS